MQDTEQQDPSIYILQNILAEVGLQCQHVYFLRRWQL